MGRINSASLLITIFIVTACGEAETSHEVVFKSAQQTTVSTLAVSCSGCHAAGGTALIDLEGRTSEQLEQSLLFYKNDEAGTSVMHRLARGYSDADISEISAYLGTETP